MKIVRPYGTSKTEFKDTTLTRVIQKRGSESSEASFVEFAKTDPDIVFAQWISAIDKIASKPNFLAKATERQYEFRQKLGEAVWKFITDKNILTEEYKDKFWEKIHPYPQDDLLDDETKHIGGRWFKTFFGDIENGEVDLSDIGQNLFDHLYSSARKVYHTGKTRDHGAIELRGKSLENSTPYGKSRSVEFQQTDKKDRTRQKAILEQSWEDKDSVAEYGRAGDIANQIYKLAKEKEEDNKSLLKRQVGSLLFEHYGKTFVDNDGNVLPRAEIYNSGKGALLDYHDAVKLTYKRILGGHKARNASKATIHAPLGQKMAVRSKLSATLPKNMTELYRRTTQGRKNQDINALIRLGKVAHYTFSIGEDMDSSGNIISNWNPNALKTSPFWTSDYQAQIKRNEALVRIWRSVLTTAIHTLTDWISPESDLEGDLTTSDFDDMIKGFTLEAFDEKALLLFGNSAPALIHLDETAKLKCITDIREALKSLRNSSFHFAGRHGFVTALAGELGADEATSKGIGSTDAPQALTDIYPNDAAAYLARTASMLRAAHVENYFNQHQLDQVVSALISAPEPRHQQPKLKRVLVRTKDTWKGRDNRLVNLIKPAIQRELEAAPAMRCKYVVMKSLYEKAFPAWLELNSDRLNGWANTAIERTTKAAANISGNRDAIARAARALDFGDNGVKSIGELHDRIAHETATEIRIQNGYEPDREAAKEKSKYLNNVVCDIYALALNDFIADQQFQWIINLRDNQVLMDARSSDLNNVQADAPTDVVHDWQQMLYVIAHLVPVGQISQLRQQLMKWSALDHKGDDAKADADNIAVGNIMKVFTLYLDMADDKFEGGKGINIPDEIRGFFEDPQTFNKLYPNRTLFDDTRVPIRGLREAMRFGNLSGLRDVFEKFPIRDKYRIGLTQIENKAGVDSVSAQHVIRTDIHAKWVKSKNSLDPDAVAKYKAAIKTIATHRELSAHVRLINHVQVQRLQMSVLGRFVDFAGIWERDLYFATIGLMLEYGKSPDQIFTTPERLEKIEQGRIIAALRKMDDQDIKQQMETFFGADYLDGQNGKAAIRNKIQHLHFATKAPDKTQNLTTLTNDMRKLMSYDRKLKNAVSKSIIDMMTRENLGLEWKMKNHQLCNAVLYTHQAEHMTCDKLLENLNTRVFTSVVATLFGGKSDIASDILQ